MDALNRLANEITSKNELFEKLNKKYNSLAYDYSYNLKICENQNIKINELNNLLIEYENVFYKFKYQKIRELINEINNRDNENEKLCNNVFIKFINIYLDY